MRIIICLVLGFVGGLSVVAQIRGPVPPEFSTFSPTDIIVPPKPIPNKTYTPANVTVNTNPLPNDIAVTEYNFYNHPNGVAKEAAFEKVFHLLYQMLKTESYDFRRAVFLTEWAYDNSLSYEHFNDEISYLSDLSQIIAKSQSQYNKDTLLTLTWAIKHLLADTVAVQTQTVITNEVFFTYDFEDVFGSDDIKKMFVTKLMDKGAGNCHSFPYLYKILADELGVGKDVHLAYAPNHLFVRMKLNDNWWNLELTSGYFLQDWYMMATGYIHTQGIQGGIYLTPVTKKESIAACLMDLATYYESKYGLDNFAYKCAMLAQEYYPNCLQALMYKANYWNLVIAYKMKKYGIEDLEIARKHPDIGLDIADIEAIIAEIDAKGYVPVPEELYQEWLESMQQEKERRAGFK